jgi:hypothetical protein
MRPNVRFSVRTMMVAVASLAVLMAAGLEVARMTRLVREYRRFAVWHTAMRDLCLAEAEEYRTPCSPGTTKGDWPRLETHERALALHHDALVAKYRQAARFPWLPVEADSPEPQ